MPGLSLSLLGTYRVYVDGKPAANFETNKVRALLAFLTVEQGPHERLRLAGLFWPEWPEAAARTYLRQALLNLRQVLEPSSSGTSFLLSNRHTIQLNPASDHWLDVAALSQALSTVPRLSETNTPPDTLARLEEAISLYQGDFLDGFYVDGCLAFEEWQLLTREVLRRQVVAALSLLIRCHLARGDLAQAQQYAWRSLQIEPLLEESHGQVMRLLALGGERNAALAHYASYRHQLAVELGVDPSREISELYEQIKGGWLPGVVSELRQPPGPNPGSQPAPLGFGPPFIAYAAPVPEVEAPCVARERELALLHAQLNRALAGRGGTVFVIGEAGRGKTTLLRAFAKDAQARYPALVTASGICSSQDGFGDALLPFREILAQLTGDFEDRWLSGAISPDHARRLWGIFPWAVEALLSHGPDLINTLIPGQGLAARIAHLPNSRAQLRQVETLAAYRAPATQQGALFDQVTRVLQALARGQPLLLWIDDLHWADRATCALLFHLGQRLAGSRLLVAGCYRPEEVTTNGEGERHPLSKVLHELQARFSSTSVDLDHVESRPFVDAYLDLNPNRLDNAFRERLDRLSEGHPLFTVELVANLRERRGLMQDASGYWVEGSGLDWEGLPSRVEVVIGERVERLPAALRAVLDVASVEGQEFTAEVVAQVLGQESHSLIRLLSHDLDRQHRLVVAADVQNVGDRHLSHYRFRHILFQKYLYGCLDTAERRELHQAVGSALQTCVQSDSVQATEAAGQLARHFALAGLAEQAIPYLCLAADRALQMSANEEAVDLYRWGLALLAHVNPPGKRRQLEADLQTGLGTALAMVQGHTAEPVQAALTRANQLWRELNDLPKLFRGLWGLWRFRLVRGEARAAMKLAQECLQIAEKKGDDSLVLEAHEAVGTTCYRVGKMVEAHEHLIKARQLYDSKQHRRNAHLYGQDPGVSCLANQAQVLWYLGYPDQAGVAIEEALARAESRGHTASIAFALVFAAGLYQRSGDARRTIEFAERTISYSRLHSIAQWVAVGTLYRGWALMALGNVAPGLDQMREGYQATVQVDMIQLRFAALLASAIGLGGNATDGQARIRGLLAEAYRLGELEWAAEMHRVEGELHLAQGAAPEAAACFKRAIALARRQGARSLELRAAISLSRLYRDLGRPGTARRRLAGVYGWFTEGFETPDLVAARRLLQELSSVVGPRK